MAKNGTHIRGTRTPRGAASPTSPQRLLAAEKQKKALDLRMAGASFDQIAEGLGYADRSGAHKAVMAGLASMPGELVEGVRELELKRLDRLWLAVWDAATKGDLEAVDACLRIMKRRADFEGLDKPKKLEHAGPGGKSIPIKHENIDPGQYTSAFQAFAEAVLGQGVAKVREDGSLEPVEPAQSPWKAIPVPAA